jgi:RHS repeat-associated protein
VKRYRYTGKERDEETGLYYHGARYYAPWLGRWTAADPAGMVDGLNLYRYSRDNPIVFSDPGGTQSASLTGPVPPKPGSTTPQLAPGLVDVLDPEFEGTLHPDSNAVERLAVAPTAAPEVIPLTISSTEPSTLAAKPGAGSQPGPARSGQEQQGSRPGVTVERLENIAREAVAGIQGLPGVDLGVSGSPADGTEIDTNLPADITAPSAVLARDALIRQGYETGIAQQRAAALRGIDAAEVVDDLKGGTSMAREASEARDVARTATQKRLSPLGKAFSETVQKPPVAFETRLAQKSVPGKPFESLRAVTRGVGESRPLVKALGRLGRVAGPLGFAVGVGASAAEIASARPEERTSVAAGEAAALALGTVGFVAASAALAPLAAGSLVAVGAAFILASAFGFGAGELGRHWGRKLFR